MFLNVGFFLKVFSFMKSRMLSLFDSDLSEESGVQCCRRPEDRDTADTAWLNLLSLILEHSLQTSLSGSHSSIISLVL